MFIFIGLSVTCLAQAGRILESIRSNNNESWIFVKDTLVKAEVAQFCKKAMSSTISGGTSATGLSNVPLISCSASYATFEKGNLLTLQVGIHINSRIVDGIVLIDSIDLNFYDKVWFTLPDSAYAGIYHVRLCQKFTKKNRPIESDCKAYISSDKKRVYIYMLNGNQKDRYEVTWVIKDYKYLMRIVDKVSNDKETFVEE